MSIYVVFFLRAGLSGEEDRGQHVLELGGPGCLQSSSPWSVSQGIEVLFHSLSSFEKRACHVCCSLLTGKTEAFPFRLLLFFLCCVFNAIALSAVSRRDN